MHLIHRSYFFGRKNTSRRYSLLTRICSLLYFLLTALVFVVPAANAQGTDAFSELAAMPGSQGARYVSTRLIIDRSAIEAEMPVSDRGVRVGVLFSIEKNWHIYWKNSGEAALPTKVSFSVPEGWEVSELQWPIPKRYVERGDITTFGYSDEILLYAYVRPPDEILEAPTSATIKAEVSYLVCNDICVPGRDTKEITVPYTKQEVISPSENFPLFERYALEVPREPRGEDSGLRIKALLSHTALAPGASGTLRISIVHDADGGFSGSDLQMFPHQSDGITFRAPTLLRGEKETLLDLPFTADQDLQEGPVNLSGVLALSPKAVSAEHPIGLLWNASLGIATEDSLNGEFAEAAPSKGSEEAELSYRSSHYAEGKAETGSKRQVSPDTAGQVSIAYALFCAFIGGMILNLMPCVLPIISIKVMGFIGGAEQPRAHSLKAALSFSLGVIVSFLLLALLVVLLRNSGISAGWGFQFQHPEFVYALSLIVFVLGLGFFDVYSLNLPGMQSANKGVSSIRSPMLKHFFDGVLATALSTPCTAPFLGTALVFAFSQAAWVTFLMFFVMGLGLALPYAYLSTHPKMLSILPTPGPWMYRFRQLMGFLLLGTVVWLVFVLQQLTSEGAVWTIASMLLIFFGSWLLSWLAEARKSVKRSIAQVVALIVIGSGLVYLYPSAVGQHTGEVKIDWKPYSAALIKELQGGGSLVFIDFTADWCITCKANEYLTIETDEVIAAMKRLNVTPVKADWTRGDQHITDALHSYGAEGVPLYVVLPGAADGEAIVLSTLPTSSDLIDAFENAKTSAK